MESKHKRTKWVRTLSWRFTLMQCKTLTQTQMQTWSVNRPSPTNTRHFSPWGWFPGVEVRWTNRSLQDCRSDRRCVARGSLSASACSSPQETSQIPSRFLIIPLCVSVNRKCQHKYHRHKMKWVLGSVLVSDHCEHFCIQESIPVGCVLTDAVASTPEGLYSTPPPPPPGNPYPLGKDLVPGIP